MKLIVLGTLVASVLSVGSNALAQDSEVGQGIYQQYCATCHGLSGAGDGPLTEMMTTSVPDLTGLSAAHDGKFPMLGVIHVIDGRTGLRAHGGPMPVYGALFTGESENESEKGSGYENVLYTRGKILSIAYYLESLQK